MKDILISIFKKIDQSEIRDSPNFNLSLEDFKTYDMPEIRNFDLLTMGSSYLVTISRNISNIRCNCRDFLKKYVCKHSLCIGIVLGFVEAQKLPFESKRPPDRQALKVEVLEFE